MLVAVFGVWPNLSQQAAHAFQALLSDFHGACAILSAKTVDDIKSVSGTGVLYFAEPPDSLIVECLLKHNVRIVVIRQPFAVAAAAAPDNGKGPLESVRVATRWFSVIADIVATEKCFVIHKPLSVQDVADLVPYLGLAVAHHDDVSALRQFTTDLAAALSSGRSDTASDKIGTFLIGLKGYDELFENKLGRRMIWPTSIFDGSDAIRSNNYTELLGPARYLVSGPYFGLPRGHWIATISFSVVGNLSGNALEIDVSTDLGDDVLIIAKAKLPQCGDYKCNVPFQTKHPHMPIEIRIFLAQGAIEGKLRFDGITLTQQ